MAPVHATAAPAAEAELHIASLVVHTTPRRAPAVAEQVARLPDAQVHAISPAGKLVVTLEAATADAMLAVIGQVQRCPGVLSATTVYQCADSLSAMNQLLPEQHPEEVPDAHRAT
jgi:periplasmic nitrate reductase NapD